MDNQMEIKEEDPLTNDIASLNEREFLHVSLKTSNDTVLVDTDCDMTVKTEVKSETPFIKHPVDQIKTESATCSSNWEMRRETEIEHQTLFSDFGSQNEGEFLLEDPLMVDNKYNSDQQMYNKIEIKEEPWSLETENSSVCDNIKGGDLSAVKSSRLCPETFADKPPLLSAEVPTGDTSFSNGIDLKYEYQKCDVTCDVLTAKEYVHSNQYGKCSDEVDMHMQRLYTKHSSLNDMSKTIQQCSICERSFSSLSRLKAHILIHADKKPHQCKVCAKSFTLSKSLKKHNLLHEGIKTHQCTICDKSFTYLSSLKIHSLAHEGKKPHQCKVCNKSFTHSSALKKHKLVHEGIKPHQCKICDKSFSYLSSLQIHYLVHEGKKPHQCQVCNKNFTHLSTLKTHNLVHAGIKPHHCKICDKRFTKLANLKTHYLVHEGKRAHQCKICDKRFTDSSALKRHNSVHDAKKPHQCKVCDKSFTLLSNLKTHNLIHDAKNKHQCKVCDKNFTRLSNLKRHNLIHEHKKTS